MQRIVKTILLITASVGIMGQTGLAQGHRGGPPNQCPSPTPPVSDTRCYSGSGCLDVSFDTDGLVATTLNANESNSFDEILIQPDGKIVGIGRISNGAGGWLVARYNSDGGLDTTFGDFNPTTLQRYGYTAITVAGGGGWANTGGLQADGRIIVAGFANNVGAAIRLDTDGTLDLSFDGDGKIFFGPGQIMDVAIQSDGKIVLAHDSKFTLIRLNIGGSLDSSFGTNGTVVLNPSGGSAGSRAWSLALQRIASDPFGDERIVIGGYGSASKSAASSFALMRVKSNGALDTSFGTSGKVLTSFYGLGDQAREIAIDPTTNKVVAGGFVTISSCSGGDDFGTARYSENGVLDTTFSGDGKLNTDVYGGHNAQRSLVVQADGKVIIGGASQYSVAGDSTRFDFTMVRYNGNGTPDATFGPGTAGQGVVTLRYDGYADNWNFAIAIQSDGRILTGGISSLGTSNGRPALARYLP